MILLAGLMMMGYYSGSATLYPYDPVYCDKDGGGPCYGVYMYLPKSAPLPITETWCKWADIEAEMKAQSLTNNWYWWKPRIVAADQQKYLGARVCYLEDKGEPRNINDMPRE
jgi:hypothetical protein